LPSNTRGGEYASFDVGDCESAALASYALSAHTDIKRKLLMRFMIDPLSV